MTTDRKPLILTIGLGHSGTTILDATLGCAPEVVGVGEALRILQPNAVSKGPNWKLMRDGKLDEIACSCGHTAQDCPVWSGVSSEVSSGTKQDLKTQFDRLYNTAIDSKSGASLVLESTPGALAHRSVWQDYDVRVINLTRDVRTWSVSRNKRRGTPVWLSQLIWSRHTSEIGKQLSTSGVPVFTLGYEEFALRPEQMLGKLCDWLGVTYVPEMLTPFGATGSHVISGNRSLRNKSLARRIQYDGSWMARPDRGLAAGLTYAVLAPRNYRLVYSNDVIGHKR